MEYIKKDCPYFEENCPGGLKSINEKLTCSCPKFKAYIDAKNPSIIKEELEKMNIHAIEKLDVMLSMQKQFANRFHKVEGLTKEEVDYWTNEYLVCIEDEIVEAEEFLDIYSIKEFNVNEYRKELIDVLHFLMDGMLVSEVSENDFKEILNLNKEEDLLDVMIKLAAKDIRSTMVKAKLNDSLANIYTLNYLLRDIRLVRQCISWKHWKKPSDTIDQEKITKAWFGMFKHLIEAFALTGMSSEDVFNVYVNKNIENILRQKYSY